MNYLPLLDKALKSPEIIDLLETHDIEVIYDFDRCYENIPDQYWATSHVLGMRMNFDENQILKTIFLYVIPHNEFQPADVKNSDIQIFDSKHTVKSYAEASNIKTTEGYTTFLGTESDWIRFDYPDHRIHYEFCSGELKKISLTITEK
jgi:hypothetical protein